MCVGFYCCVVWDSGLSLLVFMVEACGMQGHWENVSFSHMACMEARLVTRDRELIIGVPINRIPGVDLREKRACLMTVTYQILDAVGRSGWLRPPSRLHTSCSPSSWLHVHHIRYGADLHAQVVDELRPARHESREGYLARYDRLLRGA